MTELAGEVADGALLMVGLDAGAIAAARRHLAAGACDAFGLFGPPERCAERLLQAREEAGVEAFGSIIRPRIGGRHAREEAACASDGPS
jgi:hypothetical protein